MVNCNFYCRLTRPSKCLRGERATTLISVYRKWRYYGMLSSTSRVSRRCCREIDPPDIRLTLPSKIWYVVRRAITRINKISIHTGIRLSRERISYSRFKFRIQIDLVKYHSLIKISSLIYGIIVDKNCCVYFSDF